MKFGAKFTSEIGPGTTVEAVYEFPDEQSARDWIVAMQPIAGVEIFLIEFDYSTNNVVASGLDMIAND